MKNFIEVSETQGAVNDVYLLPTQSYIEIEILGEDQQSFFLYILPRSENSVFILSCWDDYFDELVDELDEDSFEIIADTWPMTMFLLVNGMRDKYREGAIIRLEDPDYGEMKWYIASVAGNIRFEDDLEDFLGQERILEAIQVVVQRSVEILQEGANKPNHAKWFWRGVGRGLSAGLFFTLLGALGIDPSDLE